MPQDYLPVSICIPAYNEEKNINKTIESCLKQNVREIIVSDNCSTDSTGEVCQKLAKINDNIIYRCNKTNIGPYLNFKAAVALASQPYCLLMGAHDFFHSEQHVKRLLDLCTSDLTAAGAYCGCKHYTSDYSLIRYYKYKFYDKLESTCPLVRIESIIRNLSDGTIVYGLYKTDNTKEILSKYDNVISDILYVGIQALKGRLLYEPDIFLARVNPRFDHDNPIGRHRRYQQIMNFDRPYHYIVHQIFSLIDMAGFSSEKTTLLKSFVINRYKDKLRLDSECS